MKILYDSKQAKELELVMEITGICVSLETMVGVDPVTYISDEDAELISAIVDKYEQLENEEIAKKLVNRLIQQLKDLQR